MTICEEFGCTVTASVTESDSESESPSDHKGDAHVPTPSFNTTHGVAWQITETEWIIRKDLSDEMLELLEKIFKETRTE